MKHSLKREIKNNFVQCIATFAVFMLSMQMGLYIGWTSPNIARLMSEESAIKSTASDISWLVSLTPIGSVSGSILGSILMEYFGSRKTVLVTFLIMGISWTCILCANSMIWLYAARIIGGLPIAMLFCCFSIYLSEVSDAKVRGTLVSLAMIGIPFGNVVGVVAETYLAPKLSTSMYLLTVLIGTSLLLYLKDTPYHMVKRNDMEKAENSIVFYRGSHVETKEKLEEIRIFSESNSTGMKDKLSELRRASVRRAMLMIIIVFGLPDASGVLIIASYTEVILKNSGLDFIKAEQCVIYSCIVSVLSSFLTIKLLDKIGRRLSLSISSVGTTIALTALGLHFYLIKSGSDVKHLQWLPVASLLLYSISYNTGYGAVPSTLLGELFAENMKSLAACLGTLSSAFFGFVVVKAYQPIVDAAGDAYVFWIHALFSITAVPCAMFLLVETKGKTFQQIQDELHEK